jgi:hypothetical protein
MMVGDGRGLYAACIIPSRSRLALAIADPTPKGGRHPDPVSIGRCPPMPSSPCQPARRPMRLRPSLSRMPPPS